MVTEIILFLILKQWQKDFPIADAKHLQELKENAENANTKKSTKTWLGARMFWQSNCSEKEFIVPADSRTVCATESNGVQ